MIDGKCIIDEARKWIGTPYLHQGRLIGIGVDCVGLIVGVGHSLGLTDWDSTDYTNQPNPALMRATMNEHLDPVSQIDMRSGDILWFAISKDPRHVAIYTGSGIIHSMFNREVIEHGLDGVWNSRIRGVWRFRGIA